MSKSTKKTGEKKFQALLCTYNFKRVRLFSINVTQHINHLTNRGRACTPRATQTAVQQKSGSELQENKDRS